MEKGFFDSKNTEKQSSFPICPQPKETEQKFVVKKTKNPC